MYFRTGGRDKGRAEGRDEGKYPRGK